MNFGSTFSRIFNFVINACGYPHKKLPDCILLRYIHQSTTAKVVLNITVVVNFLSKSCFAKATHPPDGHHYSLHRSL
ncbi:unnamed protein product, partial [Vitis vinifera]|uniref:Uncharacterized protein n=1 Tax=Vitis vinifera TaxID=29760 RepID=D7SM75_VITVI